MLRLFLIFTLNAVIAYFAVKTTKRLLILVPLGLVAGAVVPFVVTLALHLVRPNLISANEVVVVVRWGDPVLAPSLRFDPLRPAAAQARRQFGYNNDYVAFLPLPSDSTDSSHGLLCVNHEYTSSQVMYPPDTLTSAQRIGLEVASHGLSIIEVIRDPNGWRTNPGGPYSQRIHADTPIRLAGPAAGHPRLRTTGDPGGMEVLGTFNNCGGGTTPWGTVLSAEEHFQSYFAGSAGETGEENTNHLRYRVGSRPAYDWFRTQSRFDITRHPHEPNRFGWVVEVDPYSPGSIPVKRTALGRFSHEAATTALNPDGRVVVYSGDDNPMEYIYRFVSRGRFDPSRPVSRLGLLDDGVLSVARFDQSGLDWLDLELGNGPLTPGHGFHSQADVL